MIGNTGRISKPVDDGFNRVEAGFLDFGTSYHACQGAEPRNIRDEHDEYDDGHGDKESEESVWLFEDRTVVPDEVLWGRLLMRGGVGTENCTLRNNRARSDLSIGIDDRIAAYDDGSESEATVALNAEATDQSFVDPTSVLQRQQVVFTDGGGGGNGGGGSFGSVLLERSALLTDNGRISKYLASSLGPPFLPRRSS